MTIWNMLVGNMRFRCIDPTICASAVLRARDNFECEASETLRNSRAAQDSYLLLASVLLVVVVVVVTVVVIVVICLYATRAVLIVLITISLEHTGCLLF